MTTYREERRQDRLTQAQIDRDDKTAQARIRTAEMKAAQDRREAKRKAKTARRAARLASLRAHAVDLVLAPVIVTGAVLSWIGMAGYGVHGYGRIGIILPVLSEGGMWAFAAATTIALHRDREAPVWHLRTGTAVFAGIGATLNFFHGVGGGTALGAAMAVVSVSGVVAHQLITAGPRRSAIDRRIARKIREARAAAVDAAPVELDAEGGGRLVLDPTAAALADPPESVPQQPGTTVPGPSKAAPKTAGKAVTVAVNNGPYGTLSLSFIPTVRMTGQEPSNEQVNPPAVKAAKAPETTPAASPRQPRADRQPKVARGRKPKPDKLGRLISEGGKTNAEIARLAGVSVSTVERRQRDEREKAAAAKAVVNLADRRHA